MAEKRDLKMPPMETELKNQIKNLRQAQSDLKKLRAVGADESAIRRVMLLMGFGNVSPDEFLAVSTVEDMGQLVIKIGRPTSN